MKKSRSLRTFAALFAACFLLPAALHAQQGSMDWTRTTANAAWGTRCYHTSVVFDGKMWVLGGGLGHMNDVWYSTNGGNWTQATDSAGWSARFCHTSVVFNNKMWVLGGRQGSSQWSNDVWYSSDGVNWTRATASAGWSARYSHTSVVFDNKMWVMGGYNYSGGDQYLNDVWYSTNGVNWTQATDSAGWPGRSGHTSVVSDNKMWVLGGYSRSGSYKHDVWYSTDGVNWTEATANAGWSARDGHTSVVFDDKLWVLGGGFRNDVWYSADGANWTQAAASAEWMARLFHASVVFDNKVWVMGGLDTSGTLRPDVWRSGGLATLVAPNGGETWPGGSSKTIKWRTVGAGLAGLRLLFSRDGGSTYPDTVAPNVAPTETTYGWLVPVLNLNTCRVMVQMLDSGGTAVSRDASDGDFTIQTAATVASPNGGESWAGGSNQSITWRTVGSGFARYRLLLSRNGGSTYPDTIAPDVTPNETTYSWHVPTMNQGSCRVMVQILDAGGTVLSEDASDGDFTIQTAATVASPNGGETWQGGSSRTIQWRTVGSGFALFRLLLSTSGGSSYPDTIAPDVAPTESTYSWVVSRINSVTCRIKVQIVDSTGQVISEDGSDGDFAIRTPITLASSQYPMFRYGLEHTGRSRHNGAQSSDLRWFYNTAQPVASSPVVAPDTTIYVVSENDSLYAITPSGTRRWSYCLGQGAQSVPAIASDSTICVGDSQGNLVVFPRDLSSPLWRYHTGGSILSSPAIGNDGAIYVGSNDGYLYAINPDSTLKWRHNIGSQVRSSPAISPDSTIYVGADDGKLYAISPSNAEKWNVAMPAALYSSPLVGPDGTVYVGCLNGKLFAVDGQGTVKWSYATGDSIISSPAIDAGGRIFFGSCDHYVYAIEDSGSYAKLVWRYQTSGAVRSSPSIGAQGTVYIGSDDGNIYALKGSDSTVVWTRTTGSAVRSSPAIGANGTIYVGSNDGRLYAIGSAIGIEEREVAARRDIPASDILCHGEPNPFVLRTTIRFGLSRAGRASLKVYSTTGAVVRTLVSESKSPGYYTASWNGIDDRGRSVPAGIYVCRLQTAEIQTTMVMAKLK